MPASPNASAYVSPSLRAKKPLPPAPARPLASAKKTALKKEFGLDQTLFPALGETIKKTVSRGTPISFSSAAAKKVIVPKEEQTDVMPGWVHIRRHEGKIQYKYGKPILQPDNEDRLEAILSRIILKNRIAREQYDRNIDIERLGDLSIFYGEPTLAEIYSNDLEAAYRNDGHDSSDCFESDYSHDL